MGKYEITSGVLRAPVKVVLYGPEGIGKTTFASRFPDPLFIDTEGGTKTLDVHRLPAPQNWEMLLDEVAARPRNALQNACAGYRRLGRAAVHPCGVRARQGARH